MDNYYNRAAKQDAVVLLHGMGRNRNSFARLAAQLGRDGYAVANMGYASLKDPVAAHAAQLGGIVAAMAKNGARRVSFVGHSLGGIVIRHYLAAQPPLPVDKIVFLGTPNRGSYLATRLARLPPYHHIFGPCGLAVFPDALTDLPVPDAHIAIIAGGNGGRGYNRFLPGDNDGLVQVDETRLDRGEAFLRLPCLHTFLPSSAASTSATRKFLQTGKIDS